MSQILSKAGSHPNIDLAERQYNRTRFRRGLVRSIVGWGKAKIRGRVAVISAVARSEDWNAGGATCNINYYNTCTGWVWCWSGFAAGDRFGVVVDGGGCDLLMESSHFICTPAPAGYGFTGTIAVYAVDANDCPTGAPISSQPFLPSHTSPPFHVVQWGGVLLPNQFAILVTAGLGGTANPAAYGTDHPAAGPTGPAACGTCFPSTRPTHSFAYGSIGNPFCPGSTFNDGICNAELLWDVSLFFTDLSTEASSWGTIKALYR